jgi:branched-chain amino acid aminotransferase
MKENNWFEVLLVDGEGSITEGSRSNVFFVKDNDLYCAPLNKVLKGITLLKVLDICDEKGILVHFVNILPPMLSGFDAAFLTGTSPKVLPLCSVGENKFSTVNPVVEKIRKHYNQMIDEYMKIHQGSPI